MKKTRRNRTVQRELKSCKWGRDFDLKWRWNMKQRERTERTIRAEMKVTAVRSKAESSSGDAGMNNMEY